MPSPASIPLGQSTNQHHENPAAAQLDQKLSGNEALKHTNIHFPVDLHQKLREHAVYGETTLRELIRTVLEQWVVSHASDLNKIERGEVVIPAEVDGRKQRGQRGEMQTYGVYVAQGVHHRIKQVAELRKLTMRGVIVGIMQEWATDHCASTQA